MNTYTTMVQHPAGARDPRRVFSFPRTPPHGWWLLCEVNKFDLVGQAQQTFNSHKGLTVVHSIYSAYFQNLFMTITVR